MIQSMTAFARAQTGDICWELRSVNHRYLDVSLRLPESFRYLEPNLRTMLRDTLQRGKIECQLKLQEVNIKQDSLQLNSSLVNSLIDLSADLAASKHIANDMSVSTILAWPGVLSKEQADTSTLETQILSVFQQAIKDLQQARSTEGQALKQHLEVRIHALLEQLARAKTLVSQLSQQSKDKLLARIKNIQIELPSERIEQELALLLARMDVAEELDRIQTHCAEVSRCLQCDTAAGKRMDFLMQELNREANTLSSKSDSIELTQVAVEMKVLIEQMREQVQNIE